MSKCHIVISACLLGEKVRYDGEAKLVQDPVIQYWQDHKLLIPICPEVSGGLPVPRPPAEIRPLSDSDGNNDNKIRVINIDNIDVTNEFELGAGLTLQKCRDNNIQMAILTDGSPSCGSQLINDGSFQSRKIAGQGVTTALLQENNIKVFSQNQLQQAYDYYQQIIRE